MMLKFKRKMKKEKSDNKILNTKSTFHKRLVVNNAQEVKENLKHIKSCDFVPHRERIQDISEKIQSNVKFIHDEILLIKSKIIYNHLILRDKLYPLVIFGRSNYNIQIFN